MDTIFQKQKHLKDGESWEKHLREEWVKMYDFLHAHENEGCIKEKLHDQLIWLSYQIDYFSDSHDLELVEESFNWVIANFNRELNLTLKCFQSAL